MVGLMKINSPAEIAALLLGDLACFVIALWLALLVRGREFIGAETFFEHLSPFWYIFFVWIFVFFIFDLYRRPTGMFRRTFPATIFRAQVANAVIALSFFYFIPYYNLTPKTILFIDLLFSFGLIYLWRRQLALRLFKGRKEKMYFACQGPEVDEVVAELKSSDGYNIELISVSDIASARSARPSLVVIDPHNEATTRSRGELYQMFFEGTRFISIYALYEDLFDRIPVSTVTEQWFLENISNHPKRLYSFFKRLMDIVLGSALAIVSLVVLPIVWLAVKMDDGGPIFYSQERVGKKGRVFKIYKFRSMSLVQKEKITRVGHFLRRSRLDEFPQLWGVIKGDQSLIGPRPEMVEYAEKYRQEIPYYDVRHLITPGLSGWAQIYHENEPKFAAQTDLAREKLSYDLYYVKNRNLWLDITIALKTVKELLSRSGI